MEVGGEPLCGTCNLYWHRLWQFIQGYMQFISVDKPKHNSNDDSLLCLQLTQQKPTKTFSLFDDSSPFIKRFLYVSLGILAGLVFIGTVWDLLITKKANSKRVIASGESLTCLFVKSIQNDKMSFELKFYFRSLLIGAVNEEMTMTDK